MSESKRNMTPKGFIRKVTSAKSAIGFIDQYRNYMTTGELAPILSPIVAKVDSQELLPTPALNEIGNAVMNHILAEASAKIEKINESKRNLKPKNWIAAIYNSQNILQTYTNNKGEKKELIKDFDVSHEASDWADRNLIECASDCFAIIQHNHSYTKEIILRADAFARVFTKKTLPVISIRSKTTNSLSFGTHVKRSRVSFSKG
jgi:hypothetical protein